jgi:predicted lipid-binding transport protein (Tim44 family)/uncharacterized tellurite resistance protein B-like protein
MFEFAFGGKMPSKNKIRKILSFSLICFVLLFAMVLICETADARAGGGHGYSGGGGSSGGGGGGGGVYLLLRLIEFAIRYPKLGVPLLIIFLVISYFSYKKGDEYVVDSTIRKANVLLPSVVGRNSLNKIKAKDPNFSEEDFYTRSKNAFMIVQEAWSKGDLAEAEAFLADGTYEQFLIQLKVMKEKNIIDVMENLHITKTNILGFESDNNFDTIHIGISAIGKNYRANAKTKEFIEGNRFEEEFTEVWTFLRRTGVKTLKKPGLIEGYCPNCGAKITIGRHAKCSNCNAILRSGEYDWVLANITQACEWSERSNNSIPGAKRYLAHDPGFNVQHIEDLVSVMFWRKNEAQRISDVTPLRKIATNEYCDSQTNFYRPDFNGNHNFYTESAVGSIRVMGIDNETSDKDDYIYAKVIWSGIPAKKTREGRIINLFEKQNIKEVFVLKRKHGVRTDTKTTLSSAHCPNCGAAVTDSLSNECDYCGSVLNDGTRDWVLEGVFPQNDPRISKAIILIRAGDSQFNSNAGNNSGVAAGAGAGATIGLKKTYTVDDYSNSMNKIPGLTMVKWTVAMMLADGQIDPKEQEIIYEYGLRRGVGKNQIDDIVKDIKSRQNPVEYVADSTDLPMDMDLMRMLIKVAFADGKVAKQEVEMLRYVGKRMNLSDDDVRRLLMEERMRLYRMSKAVIKESKNM